jgi:hypothetical protein
MLVRIHIHFRLDHLVIEIVASRVRSPTPANTE